MITLGGLTLLNVPPWQQTSASEITMDDYGIDSMTRSFDVRPDQVNAFRLVFAKGNVDSVFPDMAITGRRIGNIGGPSIGNIGGPICKATVTYKGVNLPPSSTDIKGTAPRNLQLDGGIQLLQVTVRSQSNPDRNLNLSYRAPWSSWKYVTTRSPKTFGPAFLGKLIQNDKNPIIVSFSGDTGVLQVNPQLVNPGAAITNPGGEFSVYLKISNKKFDFHQIGNAYTVEEVNELLIVDPQLVTANGFSGW